MATMTLTGRLVRANRALAALLGVPGADLVGRSTASLTDDRGRRRHRAPSTTSVAAPLDVVQLEHGLAAAADGRRLRATLAPVRDSGGRPLYVFLQVQDVTAERAAIGGAAAERGALPAAGRGRRGLRDLHARPDGARRRAGTAEPSAARATRPSEIIGQHFRVFYPPELQARRHPEHELELALREGHYEEEGWRLRKDGSRFWATVLITAVYDADGRHIGFAKVTRDTSQRRRLEQEREQAVEALARRTRAGVAEHPAAAGRGGPGPVPGGDRARAPDPGQRAERDRRTRWPSTGRRSPTRSAATCSTACQQHRHACGGCSRTCSPRRGCSPAPWRSGPSRSPSARSSTRGRRRQARPAGRRDPVRRRAGDLGVVGDRDRLAQALDNLLAQRLAARCPADAGRALRRTTAPVDDPGQRPRCRRVPERCSRACSSGSPPAAPRAAPDWGSSSCGSCARSRRRRVLRAARPRATGRRLRPEPARAADEPPEAPRSRLLDRAHPGPPGRRRRRTCAGCCAPRCGSGAASRWSARPATEPRPSGWPGRCTRTWSCSTSGCPTSPAGRCSADPGGLARTRRSSSSPARDSDDEHWVAEHVEGYVLKDAALDHLVDLLEAVGRRGRRRRCIELPHDAEQRRRGAAVHHRRPSTEWGLESLLDDALLVASELATNAITHADSAYRLRLSLNADGLRIDVIDSGDGTPEPQPPSSDRRARTRPAPGRRPHHGLGARGRPRRWQARLGGARGTRLTDAGFPSGAGQTCVRADSTSFRRAFAPTRRHANVRSRLLDTLQTCVRADSTKPGRRGWAPSGTLLRR